MPAEAGIQCFRLHDTHRATWMPAFAGMT